MEKEDITEYTLDNRRNRDYSRKKGLFLYL